jgi:hypothetical protein
MWKRRAINPESRMKKNKRIRIIHRRDAEFAEKTGRKNIGKKINNYQYTTLT